ncbi:MAG TPA: dTDP-4-dehydrorhamnose 3,5-epimerase [Xanthobacteraceae bacterium]|nr:dTDP-4-dehydrorhamnose 3,5-epimerase [Xanthobacteraceae bacterium]
METGLSGLLLIEPRYFRDQRGFFLETFAKPRYRDTGIADDFVQENHSRSSKGVLRGLHFQVRHPQAQIVTVMRGTIFDVAVDLRQGSKTFGRWFGAELSDEGACQLYMARGFAHGFCVLSDTADLHYMVSRIYDHSDEGGLLWNDPDIGIRWPITQPVVSARDGAYPRLADIAHDRLPHPAETEVARLNSNER